MKKIIRITIFALFATLFVDVLSASASIIPRESIPRNTPQEAVVVADKLIYNTLVKVQNGLGHAPARIETNKAIYTAVLSGQTNGYGYAILRIIANNAIFEYRDMYLRPDYYVKVEEQVRTLISDLIVSVKNSSLDYESARKEAYSRIYRTVNPYFNIESCAMTDFCYWDVPHVDPALFNRARKLLLEAESHSNNIAVQTNTAE